MSSFLKMYMSHDKNYHGRGVSYPNDFTEAKKINKTNSGTNPHRRNIFTNHSFLEMILLTDKLHVIPAVLFMP